MREGRGSQVLPLRDVSKGRPKTLPGLPESRVVVEGTKTCHSHTKKRRDKERKKQERKRKKEETKRKKERKREKKGKFR